MGFKDVFKKSFLEGFNGMDITTAKIAATLFVTALLALYIFAIYRLVTRKVFYSRLRMPGELRLRMRKRSGWIRQREMIWF